MKSSIKKFFASIAGVALAIGAVAVVGNNRKATKLNAIYSNSSPWTHTFATGDITKAAQASKVLNNVTWSISETTYKGWDDNRGIQLGSGSSPQTSNWTMTAAISQFGTNVGITSISVGIATASSGGIAWSLTAGGNNGTGSTGSSNSAITSVTTKTATYATPVTSGDVVISLNSNGKSKAIYIHDISVSFTGGGSGGGSSSSSQTPAVSSSSSAPAAITVTYNSNGATSGTVPTDATEYTSGATVSVKNNTGSLSKTGYVWSGWNTKADGTGTSYVYGNTFNITSATVLYARWIKDYSNDANAIITGGYLNLDTTGLSSAGTITATDGMQYLAAPGGSNKVRSTDNPASGNKAFNSSDKAILMGKNGAYIYNKDAFQKSIGRIEVFANTGASPSVSVAVDFGATDPCSSSYDTNAKVLSTTNAIYTFNPSILDAKFFRIQVTNAYNAQVQIKVVFRIATSSVTATPESVTLAPGATQQLSTSILPANTTDLLSYSSSDNSVATVSNSGLITAVADGTATITATSGTCTDTCAVTVETPAEPFINFSKDSTSGYSGLHDNITFSYGNLTGDLSAESNDPSVATFSDLEANEGSGSVQINFVAAGTTTISFKNGSSPLGSISVSVTQSTVTITGLASTGSVGIGKTLNLGSTIAVTATGNCTNAVTWSSANDSIATVSSSGVVTGVSSGTVNITVTSNSFPAASMTCAVTVFYIIDFSNSASYNIAKPESAQTELSTALIGGYTMNLLNAHNNAQGYSYIMLANDQLSTSDSLVSNKTPAPAPITKIVFNIRSASSGSAVYNATLSSSEVKTKVTENTYTRTGPGALEITAGAGMNYRYFAISCVSASKNGQLESVEIYYDKPAATEAVNSTKTRSSLTYQYTYDGVSSYEYSMVGIRYTGMISKALWNELNAESTILGYGIVFSTITNWTDDKLEDFYEYITPEDLSVRDFYTPLTLKEHPDLANVAQKGGLLEDYYVWSLFKTVSENAIAPENINCLTTGYTAVAYIKTSAGMVFFDQITDSASSIAYKLIDSGAYDDEALEGSLYNLATL